MWQYHYNLNFLYKTYEIQQFLNKIIGAAVEKNHKIPKNFWRVKSVPLGQLSKIKSDPLTRSSRFKI